MFNRWRKENERIQRLATINTAYSQPPKTILGSGLSKKETAVTDRRDFIFSVDLIIG